LRRPGQQGGARPIGRAAGVLGTAFSTAAFTTSALAFGLAALRCSHRKSNGFVISSIETPFENIKINSNAVKASVRDGSLNISSPWNSLKTWKGNLPDGCLAGFFSESRFLYCFSIL